MEQITYDTMRVVMHELKRIADSLEKIEEKLNDNKRFNEDIQFNTDTDE